MDALTRTVEPGSGVFIALFSSGNGKSLIAKHKQALRLIKEVRIEQFTGSWSRFCVNLDLTLVKILVNPLLANIISAMKAVYVRKWRNW